MPPKTEHFLSCRREKCTTATKTPPTTTGNSYTHFPSNFTENKIQTIQLIESYNNEPLSAAHRTKKHEKKRLNIQMIACNLNENVIFLFAFY